MCTPTYTRALFARCVGGGPSLLCEVLRGPCRGRELSGNIVLWKGLGPGVPFRAGPLARDLGHDWSRKPDRKAGEGEVSNPQGPELTLRRPSRAPKTSPSPWELVDGMGRGRVFRGAPEDPRRLSGTIEHHPCFIRVFGAVVSRLEGTRDPRKWGLSNVPQICIYIYTYI